MASISVLFTLETIFWNKCLFFSCCIGGKTFWKFFFAYAENWLIIVFEDEKDHLQLLLNLFYFVYFYWEINDILHCVNLRCTCVTQCIHSPFFHIRVGIFSSETQTPQNIRQRHNHILTSFGLFPWIVFKYLSIDICRK